VSGDTTVKNKKGKAIYTAITGQRYKINSITFPKDTGTLTNNINGNKEKSLLKVGDFYVTLCVKQQVVQFKISGEETQKYMQNTVYLKKKKDLDTARACTHRYTILLSCKNWSPKTTQAE